MVEQDKSLQNEGVPELNSQEQFITKLYQKTLDWLTKDQQGKIVANMDPQEINQWAKLEGRHLGGTVWLSANLEKVNIVETNDRYFSLVMSRRPHGGNIRGKRTLSFQFGTLPKDSVSFQRATDAERVHMLIQQKGTHGSGEFFVDDRTGEVMINCWADVLTFGGRKVNRWEQNRLLKEEGIKACLEIVQKTAINAPL